MSKLGKTFKVEKITFEDLEAAGYASVTDYCRYLIKNEKDIPDRIEVYRDEMMCLTVPNVALAATLEPTGSTWQKHTSGRSSKGRGRVKTHTPVPTQL